MTDYVNVCVGGWVCVGGFVWVWVGGFVGGEGVAVWGAGERVWRYICVGGCARVSVCP